MQMNEPNTRQVMAMQSIEMLLLVIDGGTYDAVAQSFGITRTAVERRVKAVAGRIARQNGIDGLNEGAIHFVDRLRQRRDAVVAALQRFEPHRPEAAAAARVMSAQEVEQAALRIRSRSPHWPRDIALFYMLLATGARPLEIARMEVGDYLNPDGSVRRQSEVRAVVSTTGRCRPLYFSSRRLDAALDDYFAERLARGHGTAAGGDYRGLAADSRLFLNAFGEGFPITRYGEPSQQRYLCRGMQAACRKIFRYAGLDWATPLSIRHTVVARLYGRGADEEQIGLVLGINDRGAVREMFPRCRPTIAQLVDELV